MDRRTFLRSVGAVGVSGTLGALLAACGSSTAKPKSRPAASATSLAPEGNLTDRLITADWVVEENARSDRTRKWIIPKRIHGAAPMVPAPIEGYLNKTSFASGDDFILRVSTVAPTFRAFVYRMGFYGGFGARSVAESTELPGRLGAAPTLDGDTNMIECHWDPSWSVTVPKSWPTGEYLIKLVSSRDDQQYVPFSVRDDASKAAYVVQSSVTTWQAYNPYGGYSLYGGIPKGNETDLDARARVVSFDRPYSHQASALDARGSGDFLGNEFPFIYLAERHGLDVTYMTDVDFDANPALLLAHCAFISLGHDEYWSTPMRDGAEHALDKGVNLAFLGANACYRQIRFDASSNGPRRRVICYKDAAEDPITKSDPALATGGSWATDPIPRPESALIGVMYQSYNGKGPFVVADGSSWIYKGTGLRTGDKIPDVIGSEFDGFEPGYPHPAEVEILGHSPTPSVSGNLHSDLAYYSLGRGKGAVFASGTASWVGTLWDGIGRTPALLGFGVPRKSVGPVTSVTLNTLAAFGPGPASDRHRSTANWTKFYASNAARITSQDVP